MWYERAEISIEVLENELVMDEVKLNTSLNNNK